MFSWMMAGPSTCVDEIACCGVEEKEKELRAANEAVRILRCVEKTHWMMSAYAYCTKLHVFYELVLFFFGDDITRQSAFFSVSISCQ